METTIDRRERQLVHLRHRRAVARAMAGSASRKRMPRQLQPDAARLAYYVELKRQIVAPARALVDKHLGPLLEQLAPRTDARLDAAADSIREVMDKIRSDYEALSPASRAAALATKFGSRTSDFQKDQLSKQVRAGLGVDPVIGDAGLRGQLDSFTKENVALIKSVPAEYFDQVEETVKKGALAGKRATDIEKDLVARGDVAASHAKLIARDQVGKLYGSLNKTRQEDLGITSYIWRTVQDGRVREEHADREGESFDWSDPPEDGHPGQAIQCRCFSEPDLSALVDGLDDDSSPDDADAPETADTPVAVPAPIEKPTTPRTPDQLQSAFGTVAEDVFGATPTSVGVSAGDIQAGAAAIHEWTGPVVLSAETMGHLKTGLGKSGTGVPLTHAEASALATYVHEELHGLGRWKAPAGKNEDTPAKQAYRTEAGRVLEEGAVELSTVRRFREVGQRLGLDVPAEAGPHRTRTEMGIDTHHAYENEVNVVETLAHLAAGTQGRNFASNSDLGEAGQKVLDGLLHKWKPTERLDKLAAAIVVRAGERKGATREAREVVLRTHLEKLLTEGATATRLQRDVVELLDADAVGVARFTEEHQDASVVHDIAERLGAIWRRSTAATIEQDLRAAYAMHLQALGNPAALGYLEGLDLLRGAFEGSR